jgi:type III secretion system FlhB-like substrate exporter/YHS domain-containing protein
MNDTVTDPVCGMTLRPEAAAATAQYRGRTYHFCSAHCCAKFESDPAKYAGAAHKDTHAAPRAHHHEPSPATVVPKPAPEAVKGAATIYTCPMHPEVRQAGPGTCPKCGMSLEPELPAAPAAVEYTCPMHPQIVRSEPGNCPICGMALESRTPAASEENAELADMSRRFRVGAALALPLPTALGHVAGTLTGGVALLVLLLAAFALVDVPLQRHLHMARQKMSHQEAKQEHKELEGNVEIKSKVKALMRERANRRMIAAVPKADLVVMNPTHYAVALKYDDATMAAPRVLAKGADLLAMRIRDAAKEHKVPVLQAPPLARALYAHAQIDREIPAALFAAVAQVLAYVYQLRAAIAGRGPQPGDLPPLAVPPELDPHQAKGAAAPEDDA